MLRVPAILRETMARIGCGQPQVRISPQTGDYLSCGPRVRGRMSVGRTSSHRDTSAATVR